MLKQYDVLIIGAGPGGYVAAEEAAKLGLSVGVVEKKEIGGACLNVGCIPSKSYLEHASWLLNIEQANKNGISASVSEIDFEALVERKNNVVSTLQEGIHSTFKSNKIDYIQGEAEFVSDRTFKVNDDTYSGKNILLATGGHPFVADIPGLDDLAFHTTDTIFDMKTLPDKLVVIGGGVIAVEMAFAFKPFGIDVTLLEVAEDILMTVDEEARRTVKAKLEEIGVDVRTNVSIEQVDEGKVNIADGASVDFDELLVAIGRKQNLALPESMGLELDDSGNFVTVDSYYETDKPGVYAIGDLIGGYTLAHAASTEGIKAIHAMTGQREKPMDPGSIPRSLYTSPEVAEFGMNEEEAAKEGYDVITKTLPFSFNGRAIAADQTEGFVKIISETKYRQILGAVVTGAHATDLLHGILTVYMSEGTVDEIANTPFGHPTLSELSQDVAKRIV